MVKQIRTVYLFALLVFIVDPAVFAATYSGRVVGVTDGDTIKILVDRKQIKIRLAEIDTPEKRQPYGSKAKRALSDLVVGKTVQVEQQDVDRYGRVVGRVYVDGIDVNAELIRMGAAWVYRKYVKDRSLFELEAEAKAAERGLWSLPESQRVPPWEWRKARRSSSPRNAPSRPAIKSAEGFACEGKRFCRQMSNCAEARFYLEQCGLSRLDGDQDGVPCESICR